RVGGARDHRLAAAADVVGARVGLVAPGAFAEIAGPADLDRVMMLLALGHGVSPRPLSAALKPTATGRGNVGGSAPWDHFPSSRLNVASLALDTSTHFASGAAPAS